jgi:hypothetical protein
MRWLGRGNPDTSGNSVRPQQHSSTFMVEEAYGYVQGVSLKPYAAFLVSAFQLPDRQSEGKIHASVEFVEIITMGIWYFGAHGSSQ